jgi:hypothetical protein
MPSSGNIAKGRSAVTAKGSASDAQNNAMSSVAAAQRVAGCDSALLPEESSQGDNSSGPPTIIHPCREVPLSHLVSAIREEGTVGMVSEAENDRALEQHHGSEVVSFVGVPATLRPSGGRRPLIHRYITVRVHTQPPTTHDPTSAATDFEAQAGTRRRTHAHAHARTSIALEGLAARRRGITDYYARTPALYVYNYTRY